ncbi:MAG: glycosyltransferase family 4 protein [Actinomycetota bacterium]
MIVKKNNYKTLYLCYFGLREPLVQTQVLPYLREIKKGGTAVSILTFEPDPKSNWSTEQIITEKQKLLGEGIEWNFLTYHKRPSAPATLFDVVCGAWFVWRKIRREKIDILHARIHVPAMMGALAKKFTFGKKPKMLFDIRGFFPEEYTDAGVWKENGWLYKSVKRAEKWLFKESDGFVVLTEKAREILFPESAETGFDKFQRPVEVIPCCVNLKRFEAANGNSRAEIRKQLNAENRFVITYVGSFGGWYLTDAMADFFKAAKEKNADSFALVLTQSNAEMISELLKDRGLTEKDFFIARLAPSEIPKYLSAADAAISFIKPCFSKLSSSPTKIAEYLISGVPVISNRGVGDVAELIEEHKVGAVLSDFDGKSYFAALTEIEELSKTSDLRENCRETARGEFDLEKTAGAKYRRIYERLLAK